MNLKISLLIALLCISCTNDEFFFLRSNGADMPISVQGNLDSRVFILYLHGGPGNGTYIWEKFFGAIENKYAMVYWNQRAAGESQGNAKPASMTISQYVEDTHKVVALINELYNKPQIFLMGHSWGGLLGTAYLIQYPNEVSGWIEVDGAHNKILSAQLSRQWVMNYATEQIQSGVGVEYWQDALNWYNSYTGPLTYTTRHYKEYLDKAHAYFYKSDYSFYSISDYFFGRPNGLDLVLNGNYSDECMQDEIVATNLSPEMYKISIPSLFCWGRHDGTIPFELAMDAYNAIGTSSLDKSVVIFEESAHSPMVEENELFNQTIIDFITRYKN